MKIGILQCDDVMDELQPQFGNYPEMFSSKLLSIAPHWQFVTYRAIEGTLPNAATECDGYIITGSRHGVNDGFAWIESLERFVLSLVTNKVPLVGICFGHQLMAKALGGQVVKSEKGWGIGLSFNEVVATQPWMTPEQQQLNLVVSHQDQVVEIPQGATVLASSEFCPYYMLQYQDHLLSVQGHPEFSTTFIDELMERRRDRITAERIEEGKASLAEPVDDQLFMNWIVNFFARHVETQN